MGHEIVYCARCQSQLRGPDFEKGRALRVGVHSYCRTCAPPEAIVGAETVTDPPRPPDHTPRPRPALKDSTPRGGSHARPQQTSRSGAPWALGGGVGVAVLAVLVALAASSGGGPRPKPHPSPSPPAEDPPSLPAPIPAPPPDARAPREAPPKETAQRLREGFQADLKRLDSEVGAARRNEALQGAMGLLEAGRKLKADPEWSVEIDQRVRDLNLDVERLYLALKEEAMQAKRRGEELRVNSIRERVAGWGLAERTADLARALAAVPAERPAPPAPAPSPARSEAEAFRARWEAARASASVRDYAGGRRELEGAAAEFRDDPVRAEAAADLEAFRQAEAFYGEAVRAIASWPRGEKLVLAILDASAAPQRVEVKVEGGLPWGQVVAGSLVEALRTREPKKPVLVGSGPAFFCLLDGDPEGARACLPAGAPAVPEKYWTHAKQLAEARAHPDAREKEARMIGHSAEQAYPDPAAAADAVLKFRSLLQDFAETPFVRRNREWISARAQGGREFLFLATDWIPSGCFRPGRHNKMESCWISDRDEPPARTKDNFVEIVFSALPDAEYRCWVYVGGCCQEVLGFSLQGSELSRTVGQETVRCEPGGDAFLPAKVPTIGLPKTHASHTGPKEPDRWIWVQVPLPKYASPGAKRLRLHSTQKGFSAAHAFVSALRSAPPREAEIKDAEKARNDASGGAPADPALVGLWKFDEGRGMAAADLSRSRNHALLKNGPVWSAGKLGGALSFDGVDDCLDVPDLKYASVVDTFTMAFWASPLGERRTTPESVTGVAGTEKQRYAIYPSYGHSYGPGHSGAGVSVGANGVSVFEHANSLLPSLLVHDAPISGWVHVAVVYESRQPRLYLNGALVKTGLASPMTVHPSPPTGGNSYGYYQGALDDVRIYSRALAPSEVAALAGVASPPPAPRSAKEGLLALYRFDEAKGTTVRDVSGVGTPLDLEIAQETAVRWLDKRGLAVHQPTLLASPGPATKIVEACRATHELTIEAWIRPANSTQTGPARVVSLSADPNQRNFTLGQAAGAYDARLRTTRTNANGIPSVAGRSGAEPRLTHVVYSRSAAGAVRIFVGGREAAAGAVAGDFSTWNPEFRLLLANEPTRDRAWLGEYHLVAVYSRAFTAAEASQRFKAGLE